MKILTKQEERLERKKKKIDALANIMRLNEEDREMKKKKKDGPERGDGSGGDGGAGEPETKKKKLSTPPPPADVVEPPVKAALITTSKLTDDEYKQMRRDLDAKRVELVKKKAEVEQRKRANAVPKLRLKFIGERALMVQPSNERAPILLDDIQHLLMASLLKAASPFTPWRWCHLEKINKVTQTVVLVVEGLTAEQFSDYESWFRRSGEVFETKMEILLPSYQPGKIIEDLACVPLTESYKERLMAQYGTLEAAMGAKVDHTLVLKAVFPMEERRENGELLPETDKFPRTQLLMTPLQMIDEDYPMPIKGDMAKRCKGYIMSKDRYEPVTPSSPMFGLDCEMCKTVTGRHEVARVSIVNEQLESVYETLVRPEFEIMDYLTKWSGITKEIMEGATKTLSEVQQELRALLPPNAILVGQSLQFDLHGLRMMHPYIIDTSVIFNMTGERDRKSKLQTLAKEFLNEEIQKDITGHNSIEDCSASMKLTKLKLSNDIYFGDLVLQRKRTFNEKKHPQETAPTTSPSSPSSSAAAQQTVTTTIFSHAAKKRKKSAIISTQNTGVDYERYFRRDADDDSDPTATLVSFEQLSSGKKAVKRACEVVHDHDFMLTHVKLKDGMNEERLERTIGKVDKWLQRMWRSVSLHGLFVVLLAGNASNGVALVQIKTSQNCSFANSAEDDSM